MIINLEKFVREEEPVWQELESILDRLHHDAVRRLTLSEVRRLHYLYQRTSADLAKVATFSSEPEMARYLEALVARAYGEVHSSDRRRGRLRPLHWFFKTFPQTFRRHTRVFLLVVAITLVGAVFGGGAVALDTRSKSTIFTVFPHLLGDPSERVRKEERGNSRISGRKGSFAGMLMVNNTKVSITAMGLGMTYGLGTIIVLFYNGLILGAVGMDYLLAGEGVFLGGWLLPHGSVEIPAILIAGQAGLLLAGALIGHGQRLTLRTRLRRLAPDLVTLIFGVAVLLVWAGIIEAFFSQYHHPVVPYWVKITFGAIQLSLLAAFLARSGRATEQP